MIRFISRLKLTETNFKFIGSGIFFLIIGACAATVHFFVFILLLPLIEFSNHSILSFHAKEFAPEISNFLAFLAAFSVSFLGHRNLSFKDNTTSTATSLYRFFTTAVTGFLINEIILIISYRVIGIRAEIGVVLGMLLSAVTTFTLSRYWAFKR